MDNTTIEVIAGLGIPATNFVATKIYTSVSGLPKNFIWQTKYPALSSLKINLEFSELKRRTKIIVIDDEDSFPQKLFTDEGYSIEKWDTVKDYGKLLSGAYDLIVLDIKGIATHISDEDGLGVLEGIKQANPAQIVIAYSQHTYDLNKSKFWELADEKIGKPSDFLKIKKIIDNLIMTKYQPLRYINILHDILRKKTVSEVDIKKLDANIVKCIKSKKNPDWPSILHFIHNNNELYSQILQIGNTIIKFYQ